MSIGELWVQSDLFPWLLIVLAFWVGTVTILIWRMWYKIERLKNHQELTMGGIGILNGKIDNQTNQSRKRAKLRFRRSQTSHTSLLRTKRRRILSQEREQKNNTQIREDGYPEVAPTVEIQTAEGAERQNETKVEAH